MKLPVIVGMGGINAAGRTSGFHSYKRMVYNSLSDNIMHNTWQDLATRMQLSPNQIDEILAGTLVRQIDIFDPNNVYGHKAVEVSGQKLFTPAYSAMAVQSAGMIPRGFDLGKLYSSHNHPRGLMMTVYGMSDALSSLGIEWQSILEKVHPDRISVYAGSALSQVDENSLAGLVELPLKGKRVNSKMMPLSLAEMPADFINSYILNSIGTTGHNMGACATFLYNLRQGIRDIQHGEADVVIVGSAEAPVNPVIIDGFAAMSALSTDDDLRKLDGVLTPDYRRSCRPFSTNTGFVIAESAQFAILMSDDLALELGAPILGSVANVFVNADGNKKSIASPGIGNYITMTKACKLAQDLGMQRTYVHAHGTGTPQNRVTESHILSEVAQNFNIEDWPVCAIKAYVGHSIGAAAGDQLAATLGAWQYGILPGIQTIDHIAADVYTKNLNILLASQHFDMQGCLINSKGFGGNNASALIASPQFTLDMLAKKHGRDKISKYVHVNDKVKQKVQENDEQACSGNEQIIYHFGSQIINAEELQINQESINLKTFTKNIELSNLNHYIEYQ